STVIFLTFFTNIALMASFLGVSVGCLAARRRGNLIDAISPLTFLAVLLGYATLWVYLRYNRVVVDLGDQRSPQILYFGADARVRDVAMFVIPIEVIAGTFFVLIALLFVGLGQVLGRRFDAIPSRVGAYTADILGSLSGIVAFGATSLFRLPS